MKRFVASLACSLVLAACGSSGGGDSENNNSTAATSNAANTAATTQTTSSTATQSNQATSNTVAAVNTPFYASSNVSDTAVTFPSSETITKIKVEGAEFDLSELRGFSLNKNWVGNFGGRVSAGGATFTHYLTYTGSQNVTVGAITSEATGNSYAYYNGKFTDASQVPTSGSATYNVSAVKFSNGSQTASASNTLVANFDEKTLTGSVQDVALSAKIDGNRFASASGAAVEVKGGFFGENASEIGGVYKDGNAVGAFVGSKE